MNPTNRMGLRAAGATSLLLLTVFGVYGGGKYYLAQREAAQTQVAATADTTSQLAAANADGDDDGDGLANKFEKSYRTDSNNADTDADGTSDRDEILAGRDPAVAGINDSVQPPTGQNVADTSTHTGRYLASLPADVPREEILDKARLEAYVNANKGQLLPALPAGTVKTNTASGKEAIAAYLDAISSSHNTKLQNVTNDDIERAFASYVQQQPSELTTLTGNLEGNVRALEGIAAPTEVADMHEKLLKATTALLDSTRSLRSIDKDFVAGLIASRNILDLGTVFGEIANSVKELETKYGLE